MEFIRRILAHAVSVALLSAVLLFVSTSSFSGEAISDLGPLPTEVSALQVWMGQWPLWKAERLKLDRDLQRLRERLREQGEAEANGERPSWWDLPSRQRQSGRLRNLRNLQRELELATARWLLAQAKEAAWAGELHKRKENGSLTESLAAVAKDLQNQAEIDRKYKEESL